MLRKHSYTVRVLSSMSPAGTWAASICASTAPSFRVCPSVTCNGAFRPSIAVSLGLRTIRSHSLSIRWKRASVARLFSAVPSVRRCHRRGVITGETGGLGARFRICISERAVGEQLTALLGEVPARPVEFARAMELTTGFGNQFARYILAAANDFEHANSIGASAIATTSFEQFIVCELLLRHPHNYSEALMRLKRTIASRDVKRAIDYMHANLEAPVTIADISSTAGVAGRTLFKHFQDTRGVSPMQYLRNLRFEKAKQELLNAQAGMSVTEIAARWGFGHLGRFAVEYRKRFGESPSETLRRR